MGDVVRTTTMRWCEDIFSRRHWNVWNVSVTFLWCHISLILLHIAFFHAKTSERVLEWGNEVTYVTYYMYVGGPALLYQEGSFNLLCTCQMETSTFPSAWNYINARTSTFVSSYRCLFVYFASSKSTFTDLMKDFKSDKIIRIK